MGEHKYNIIVSSDADVRMVSHIRFLSNVSISAAERLYKSLDEAIDDLKSNAEMYPSYISQIRPDITFYFKLFSKRYRIVFEIIGNNVYIHDIQDCRQDTDKNLI